MQMSEGADPLSQLSSCSSTRGRLADAQGDRRGRRRPCGTGRAQLELEATTAVPLPADLRERVVAEIQHQAGRGQSARRSRPERSVDASMLGEFVVA